MMYKMPKRWWEWACQEGYMNQLGIVSKYTYHFRNLISHPQVENYKPSRACVITEATYPPHAGVKKRQRTPVQKVLVSQSCPTLFDPIDCSPPGSSVHKILQAKRIPEWVAIPFSKGSSQPRDRTHISCIAGRFFTVWVIMEALCSNCAPSKCPPQISSVSPWALPKMEMYYLLRQLAPF